MKDVTSFIRPIENLIDVGIYGYENGEEGLVTDARMPGFLPIYAPLYWLLGSNWAHTFICFLNIVLDALTIIMTAKLAQQIIKLDKIFQITCLILSFNSFLSFYNHSARSETISTFFLVGSIFFFFQYVFYKNRRNIIIAGIGIAWSLLFRPAHIIYIGLIPFLYFLWLIVNKDFSLPRFLKLAILLVLPSFIVISAWTYRNYTLRQKFIPLSNTWEYWADPPTKALTSLIMTFRGDIVLEPYSMRAWFQKPTNLEGFDKKFSDSNPFDNDMFTSAYNFDSLVSLRQQFWKGGNDAIFINKCKTYIKSFQDEVGFWYHVKASFKLTFDFILLKQVYGSPFIKANLFCKLNKAFFLAIYYFILSFSIVGIIIAFQKRQLWLLLIAILPLAHILTHSVLLVMIEKRYFFSALPILTILSSYGFCSIFGRILSKYF